MLLVGIENVTVTFISFHSVLQCLRAQVQCYVEVVRVDIPAHF